MSFFLFIVGCIWVLALVGIRKKDRIELTPEEYHEKYIREKKVDYWGP